MVFRQRYQIRSTKNRVHYKRGSMYLEVCPLQRTGYTIREGPSIQKFAPYREQGTLSERVQVSRSVLPTENRVHYQKRSKYLEVCSLQRTGYTIKEGPSIQKCTPYREQGTLSERVQVSRSVPPTENNIPIYKYNNVESISPSPPLGWLLQNIPLYNPPPFHDPGLPPNNKIFKSLSSNHQSSMIDIYTIHRKIDIHIHILCIYINNSLKILNRLKNKIYYIILLSNSLTRLAIAKDMKKKQFLSDFYQN